MTNVPVDTSSDAYKRGYADGQANGKKWQFIAQMWGGLGLFLFLVLIFVAMPTYKSYNEHQIKHDKLAACTHATDVTACIKAVNDR